MCPHQNGLGGGDGPKLVLTAPDFCGKFAVPMSEFKAGVVGAKSQNTAALFSRLASGGLPDWVGLPRSVALPFGTFEEVLAHPLNKVKHQSYTTEGSTARM